MCSNYENARQAALKALEIEKLRRRFPETDHTPVSTKIVDFLIRSVKETALIFWDILHWHIN